MSPASRIGRALRTALSPDLVTGGMDYFTYQVRLAREVVLPWLEQHVDLDGSRVGDFGCHEGGMLEGLRGSSVATATGFEVNAEVVRNSRFVPDDRFQIEVLDLTRLPRRDEFDLIILHDVLEHVVDAGSVLVAARQNLAPGGHVFVSFPPYWSGYGGHQHLAASRLRVVPYLHYLPGALFFRLAAPVDNEYMSSTSSLEDLRSVRQTRLSLAKADREIAAAGFRVVTRELFLLRPEYRVRYGIPELRAGLAGTIPGLRELIVGGAFYLLGAESGGDV